MASLRHCGITNRLAKGVDLIAILLAREGIVVVNPCFSAPVRELDTGPVNGARNFPNYGEVKFPSLAGGVIRRRFDRGLRFLAAVRDV